MKCPECESHRVFKVTASNAKPTFAMGQSASYGSSAREWQCSECQHRWPIEPEPKTPPAQPSQQEQPSPIEKDTTKQTNSEEKLED